MKPNSSMLKMGAAIVLAMGLAACDDRPEDPQTPDVTTEQGQGDVDLYGPDADQRGVTREPGMTTEPGTTTQPGMTDPATTQPAGEGDVDLYGTPPEQELPSDSPYGTETQQRGETQTTPQENQPLPTRP